MRTVFADFLAAGTKAGDRSCDFLGDGDLSVHAFGGQNHVVVHRALEVRDGSGFFHKEGEGQADIARRRISGKQAFPA